MFKKILIANRGEIACRILRTLRRMGIQSVAIASEADLSAPHALQADETICIGPAPVHSSYLHIDAIIKAALDTGAEAIHPGYGLLSENSEFAQRCEAVGIAFIGPTPAQLRDFGLKHTARALAEKSGAPLPPGTGLLADVREALAAAQTIRYPIMLKSTAGGGGIGMKVCRNETDLISAFEEVSRLGAANFKSSGIFLEKYIEHARHIEVQIFGDGAGTVIPLGERDCSAQRRNQKVIEETPAPNLTGAQRTKLFAFAVDLAASVNYRSAGTVEFVLDADNGEFYFLEVNTRLQVEHGVTEEVTGIDLVEWMIRLAAGDRPPLENAPSRPNGHSIQVRIYAEDPARNFEPCAGMLTDVAFPENARCDSWVGPGSEITPYYDPLLAKIIVHAATRKAATEKLAAALARMKLSGIETNLNYLRQVISGRDFRNGEIVTRSLADFHYVSTAIEVLQPGQFTTVQDFPGRLGYWEVGVPPSGPMDALAFRLGNRLLGNPEEAAGLEFTLVGGAFRFRAGALVCLAGARMKASIDGVPLETYAPASVPAGATLKLGGIDGPGSRTYLLIRGGIDVPVYLGSRSTFTLGQFGGHGGRVLRAGDILQIKNPETQDLESETNSNGKSATNSFPKLNKAFLPPLTRDWKIGVIDGPQGAPDFFTADDIATFFNTHWEVHYQSARTGVRLLGPKPRWARADGGEAGLHPSNIHDNAYAVGTIDFTGDMPVILGPDGPSLGGFVCPATIARAELWKLGQLRPGDKVQFIPISIAAARTAELEQDAAIASLDRPAAVAAPPAAHERVMPIFPDPSSAIRNPHSAFPRPEVTYRTSGDRYLLVEYGPMVLDLDLRFRVHALQQWLRSQPLAGIIDLTPGIRSLQIHYDARLLSRDRLLEALRRAEDELPSLDALELPSRIVHLPLSWDDEATRLAIRKYTDLVRPDAPWCPSNIEFIRRINGLDSIDDVHRIVFDAGYLVLGLGDVYLGAPVATPLDPRHRLVTTKYNPARTWTPENAVGIGGAYLCIYGMEGPGGYQFVGRTVPMWNRWRATNHFLPGRPWLLRFFDQIRFYPVSHPELQQLRRGIIDGTANLKIEETTFRLADYHRFLASIAGEARAFKARQQAAFDAERARWAAAGEFERADRNSTSSPLADDAIDIPDAPGRVDAPLSAHVCSVAVREGSRIEEGGLLAVLEAMKMERPLLAHAAGIVRRVVCRPGQPVQAGQPMFLIEIDTAAAATGALEEAAR